MKKILFASLVMLLLSLTLNISGFVVFGQEATPTPTPTTSNSSDKLKELRDKIDELQGKVTSLQEQGKSLASQIAVFDNQIRLTELRINATEQEIAELTKDIGIASKKIENLEGSLNEITKVLINRIVTTYQIGAMQPVQVLMTSGDIEEYVVKSNYVRIAQENDKKLLYNTVQAKNDYENQKGLFEEKKQKVETLKAQLEGYTKQLDNDKKAKQSLLEATQNDEKKYQQLLAAARAEYTAIQGIVAGKGTETESGKVSAGQKIASIISGPSCNSSGGHLHFIVSNSGSAQNPFTFLKGIDHNNCSGSSCGSGDGDPFNPSGSWDWPVNGPITFNQGYGETWAVRNTWAGQIYRSHNGIDINGSSNEVKAVQSGTLFQGSYTGSGGCRLPYVRVHHDDGGLDTFYLHVYY